MEVRRKEEPVGTRPTRDREGMEVIGGAQVDNHGAVAVEGKTSARGRQDAAK